MGSSVVADLQAPALAALHDDDMRVAAACLARDEAAWRAFFAEYRGMCQIIARKYRVEDEFDDLFSTFLMRLLGASDGPAGALARYDGRVRLKTYLSAVFYHVIIDHCRARKSRPVAVDDPTIIERQPCVDTGLAALDAPKDIDQIVSQAVQRLAPQEQALIELYHFQKLTVREIGHMLACSHSTVSRTLAAIHKQLRLALAEYADWFQ
jgi:RNA polymerase sigma factor (sigma-70 family)